MPSPRDVWEVPEIVALSDYRGAQPEGPGRGAGHRASPRSRLRAPRPDRVQRVRPPSRPWSSRIWLTLYSGSWPHPWTAPRSALNGNFWCARTDGATFAADRSALRCSQASVRVAVRTECAGFAPATRAGTVSHRRSLCYLRGRSGPLQTRILSTESSTGAGTRLRWPVATAAARVRPDRKSKPWSAKCSAEWAGTCSTNGAREKPNPVVTPSSASIAMERTLKFGKARSSRRAACPCPTAADPSRKPPSQRWSGRSATCAASDRPGASPRQRSICHTVD